MSDTKTNLSPAAKAAAIYAAYMVDPLFHYRTMANQEPYNYAVNTVFPGMEEAEREAVIADLDGQL